MNKTIKKIVALGLGTTMLAGTAFSALAADLSDYPSPFVKDGVFVGKIVIGEKAASIDTVGALDIAASLQRSAAVSVSGSSGSSSVATSVDGYKFQENENLILGGSLDDVGITTLDDSELPDLLASGLIEADDGTEYEYDVELSVGTAGPVVAALIDSDLQDEGYEAPVVYFDLDNGNDLFYTLTIDFQDLWGAEDFVESETIELFGTSYTFDPDNANDEDILTLFGSENTVVVGKGATETVTYQGEEYTLEVLGGNSDDSTAILRVNGDTTTVEEGDSKTLSGLPVYIKNVFVSNIGGDDVSVQLFVGSNKLELDEDGTVTKNGVELDEVTATYTKNASNWADIDVISFQVYPAAAEDEVKFILPGEAYVDPVFGAFKFEFVGSEDLSEGKEELAVTRSGDTLSLEFMPRESSDSVTVELFDNAATQEDIWNASTLTNVGEDKIFFWNDGTAEDNYATHVLQIESIDDGNTTADDDFEVVISDLSHNKEYTVSSSTSPISSDIGLYAKNGSDADHVTFSTSIGGAAASTVYTIYTGAGAKLEFLIPNATNGTTAASGISGAQVSGVVNTTFKISEDVDDDDETSTPVAFNLTFTWDTTDSEYDITGISTSQVGSELGDNDDVSYYLTGFGTYIEMDEDENSWAKVFIPAAEVAYDAFLLPVASEVTVSSGSSGGAVALNPIAVGLAILDSEADLGSKPYIVVGGPCANTIAAELMGNNPSCAEGFSEGKAIIKLYDSQNALLVAGYSGKDTQGASRVLANYDDYAFDGAELEVVTTNLNSLSVKKVSS
ncbi:MAG TPA: hypothetical protein VEC16_07260 [Alphaproteobacteria bacterium]|nr:hypothetical protein [Alphaproteobacteria bacterium]